MRRLILGTAAALFLAVLPAAARQGAGAAPALTPRPLPAEKLQGTRLVDADANLSIDVPGPGWEWSALAMPSPSVSTCYAVTNQALAKRFLVLVFASTLNSLEPSFLAGVKASLPEKGAGVEFEDVAVPPGAKRYRFHVAGAAGLRYCVVYLVATGRPVALQSCGPEAADPPEMTPWLASFHTLHPVKQPAVEDQGAATGVQFLVVFFVVVLACGLVNLLARRLVVNSWRMGGYAVALLALVEIGALFASDRVSAAAPYAQGERVGFIVGSAVIPLVVSFVGAASFEKRRRRAAAAAAAGDPRQAPRQGQGA